MRRSTGRGLVTVALAGACYLEIGRPWQLTRGATPEEVARPFAGDDLIPAPAFDATRADHHRRTARAARWSSSPTSGRSARCC